MARQACRNRARSAERGMVGGRVHRTLVRLLNRNTEIRPCGARPIPLRAMTGCDNPAEHQGPHHAWWADISGEYTVIWEDR